MNPEDYFTRVFPATTVRAADGTYSKDVFPFPTTVVQSAAVPAGKAVMGLPAKYFMGLGTQSGGDRVLRRVQVPGAAEDLRNLPLRLRTGHG